MLKSLGPVKNKIKMKYGVNHMTQSSFILEKFIFQIRGLNSNPKANNRQRRKVRKNIRAKIGYSTASS
jgi:hypothetical protein